MELWDRDTSPNGTFFPTTHQAVGKIMRNIDSLCEEGHGCVWIQVKATYPMYL